MSSFCSLGRGMRKAGRETWVKDSQVTHCSLCLAAFGLLTRRHHCRACGNIFCSECTGQELYYTPNTRKHEQGYTEKRKRVCNICYKNITEERVSAGKSFEKACAARKAELATPGKYSLSLDDIAKLQAQLQETTGETVELDDVLQFYRENKWLFSNAERQKGGAAELMSHTADVIVHFWGRTIAEGFAQVCLGMFQQMTDLEKIEVSQFVEVEATGLDLLDLLYHFLDEFLFIFGTEMHISRRVEILEFDEEGMRIRAKGYGEMMDLNRHTLKAVAWKYRGGRGARPSEGAPT